jgi:hypothetical protein
MLFLPTATEFLRLNVSDLKYFIVSDMSTPLLEVIKLSALLSIQQPVRLTSERTLLRRISILTQHADSGEFHQQAH